MSDVWTAIVGGGIGVAASGAVRAIGIPGELRINDAAVADRDDALATWVADRDHTLRGECATLRSVLPPTPDDLEPIDQLRVLAAAGRATPEQSLAAAMHEEWVSRAREVDRAVSAARAAALHQYRDEARRARLRVAEILSSEGWAHRAWRWWTRRPSPVLETPVNANPVLDSWRLPSDESREEPVLPEDATRRTLEDAIATLRPTGP